MNEVQVTSGIIWRQHIDQLRPTAVGPDTVEVSEPEVVSLPPVPIQQSAPPNVVQFQRCSWLINQIWILLPLLKLPIHQKRSQIILWFMGGDIPRE